MQDTQLYQQILGLEHPWRVTGVAMKRESRTIEVAVACADQVWACPECGQRAHLHDYETRRWRHLDSCQFKTLLVAEVPRVKCEEHGTLTVKVPWAEKHGRFTAYFERLAIDVMLECSISAACELLGISWAEADGIKQRAVKRGMARRKVEPMPTLCVDEKSFGRGHDYVTLVFRASKAEPATVQHIADERKQEALDGFWRSLTPEQLASIDAVAMDMWEPYLLSTRAHVPDADSKIVHDPFHLVRHLNEAVDAVRRAEHKALMAEGDDRLRHSRQAWLYGFERLPEKWRPKMDELRTQKLKTARAWAIKEMFRELWTCASLAEARAFFADWYVWASRCQLAPIQRAARMMKRHVQQILTYFVHRLTNAAAEGMNNKIQSLIKKAYGYRSRIRFKTDIFFHCGGLDLYPAFTQC
jgi:transposase